MKASRKRKYYKSVDHWLDAVYRKNKNQINKKWYVGQSIYYPKERWR